MPHECEEMRTHDPKTPRTIGNAKSVLRAMVKRRSSQRLTKIAEVTGIECEQLKCFRRGGELSVPELQRLTGKLLYGRAKYHADTDTLTAKEDG
jgi:hypothetical protein